MHNKLSTCFFFCAVLCSLCTSAFSQDLFQSLQDLAEYWGAHGYFGSAESIYRDHPDLLGSEPYAMPTGQTASSSDYNTFTNILVFPSIQAFIDSNWMYGGQTMPSRSDWSAALSANAFRITQNLGSYMVSNAVYDKDYVDDDANPITAFLFAFPHASGSTRVAYRNIPTCRPYYRVFRDEFGSVGSWEGWGLPPSLYLALTGDAPLPLTDTMLYLDDATYQALRTNILRRTTVRFWGRLPGDVGGEQ